MEAHGMFMMALFVFEAEVVIIVTAVMKAVVTAVITAAQG
jgi:hypothetical protein